MAGVNQGSVIQLWLYLEISNSEHIIEDRFL